MVQEKCFLTSGCQDMDFCKTLTQCDGNGNRTGMRTSVVTTLALLYLKMNF